METEVRRYLSRIGAAGGRKSRRRLAPGEAKEMVRVREAQRAYREFHTECFWSFDPDYRVTRNDVPWVIDQLRKNGSRRAWDKATQLCR